MRTGIENLFFVWPHISLGPNVNLCSNINKQLQDITARQTLIFYGGVKCSNLWDRYTYMGYVACSTVDTKLTFAGGFNTATQVKHEK